MKTKFLRSKQWRHLKCVYFYIAEYNYEPVFTDNKNLYMLVTGIDWQYFSDTSSYITIVSIRAILTLEEYLIYLRISSKFLTFVIYFFYCDTTYFGRKLPAFRNKTSTRIIEHQIISKFWKPLKICTWSYARIPQFLDKFIINLYTNLHINCYR
jgi:hypothetical protein